MATERRRQIAAAALLVVLGVVLYRAWGSLGTLGTTSAVPGSASNGRGRGAKSARASETPPTAPDVHIRALEADRPKPVASERDLFRFKPKPPPPEPRPVAPVARPAPIEPPGPPPLPPIALKFIGIVEETSQKKKIAALVDSTGHSFQGAEGDVVAGQYRILKIGVESIEMAYLDGRGRQTIRLSGS